MSLSMGLLLVFFTVIFLGNSGYSQMKDVAPWITNDHLKTTAFYGENLVWIAGDSGIILKSFDAGDSWLKLNTGFSFVPQKLSVFDSLNLLLRCKESYDNAAPVVFISSNDGGLNWNLLSLPFDDAVLTIWPFDINNWIAFGKNQTILRTSTGGNQWEIQSFNDSSKQRFQYVCFVDTLNGWLSARHTTHYDSTGLFRTSDGGLTWNKIYDEYMEPIFITQDIGYTSNTERVIKTTNGGINWFVIHDGGGDMSNFFIKAVSADLIYVASYGYLYGTDPTLSFSTNGGLSWVFTDYNQAKYIIYDIAFNGTNLILCGQEGFIGRTNSKSTHVEALNGEFIAGIYQVDNTTFAVSYRGELYKSTDYGESWSRINAGYSNVNKIFFVNSSVGFIMGYYKILRTLDAGETWEEVFTTYDPLKTYSIDKNEVVYISPWFGKVIKSTDYGSSWLEIPAPDSVNNFAVIDSLNMWITVHPNLFRTTDGGISWQFLSNVGWIRHLQFFTKEYGIIAQQQFYNYTTNSGATWNNFPEGQHFPAYQYPTKIQYFRDDYSIHLIHNSIFDDSYILKQYTDQFRGVFEIRSHFPIDIFFYNEKEGWLVSHRKIFRVTIPEVVSSSYPDPELPSDFALNQNYPNPFNPSTKITYNIKEEANVTLKIYDILGVEIEVLVNEKINAGTYETIFDGSNLASGMYVYRLDIIKDDKLLFSKSHKMILLK
jgi:photosystem II stability/assembly factor-like uncharacterized protein